MSKRLDRTYLYRIHVKTGSGTTLQASRRKRRIFKNLRLLTGENAYYVRVTYPNYPRSNWESKPMNEGNYTSKADCIRAIDDFTTRDTLEHIYL